MISTWTKAKLEAVQDSDRVLVRDSLRLLPEADGLIHNFAKDHGFTVIVCSTNLVFRELYERVKSGVETRRVIETCGAADYQKQLAKELAEIGNSEMWRAGKATRDLRPKEPARQITSDTKGVAGRGAN